MGENLFILNFLNLGSKMGNPQIHSKKGKNGFWAYDPSISRNNIDTEYNVVNSCQKLK